jgi:hypothetical protein
MSTPKADAVPGDFLTAVDAVSEDELATAGAVSGARRDEREQRRQGYATTGVGRRVSGAMGPSASSMFSPALARERDFSKSVEQDEEVDAAGEYSSSSSSRSIGRQRDVRVAKQHRKVFPAAHVLPPVGKGGKVASDQLLIWKETVRDVTISHDREWVIHLGWSNQAVSGPRDSKISRWEARNQGGVHIMQGGVLNGNVLGAVDNSGGPWYIDGSTGAVEGKKERLYRVQFWSWLKSSLVHHATFLEGVSRYDNAALVLLVVNTFEGDRTQLVLDNIVKMTNLSFGGQWSVLGREVARLHSEMSQVSDPNLRLPPGLLPAFALRALDGRSEFAVQTDSLRKSQAGVEEILLVINTRDAQFAAARAGPNLRGYHGNVGGGRGKGGGRGGRGGRSRGRGGKGKVDSSLPESQRSCWAFLEGRCKYGDECIFNHATDGPGCLSCGDLSHGYDECTVRLGKAPTVASIAKMESKMEERMSAKFAEMSAASSVSSLASSSAASSVSGGSISGSVASLSAGGGLNASVAGPFKPPMVTKAVPVMSRAVPVNPFCVYGAARELEQLWHEQD